MLRQYNNELIYLQETLQTMQNILKCKIHMNHLYQNIGLQMMIIIFYQKNVYILQKNAVMIDKMMYYIKNNIGKEYQKIFYWI